MDLINKHYTENRRRYVKQMTSSNVSAYDAEDIVQEAYARAIKYYNSFDPVAGKMDQWLSGILSRCRKNFLADQRRGGMTVEIQDDMCFSSDEFGENNKLAEEMLREIAGLDDMMRQVNYLYFVKNYKPRWVAEVLDCNQSTVRVYVMRFKIYIRDKYGEEL